MKLSPGLSNNVNSSYVTLLQMFGTYVDWKVGVGGSGCDLPQGSILAVLWGTEKIV
jgi:hypothetical protein